MQRSGQCLEQREVTFGLLHLNGFFSEAALIQIFAHSLQQIDMSHFELAMLLGEEPLQKTEVFAHLQLILGGVVEDPETELIAQSLAPQELFGEDLVWDLV